MLVALYVRVSTAEQVREGYSISEQAERLKKYCEAMNWTVYKVYTDAGFSGASIDRPALSDLIKEAKKKSFEKVLVYKLDRLSRSQKDTLLLIEDVFLKNGVDFVSMSENFDTSTPFGRAMIGILAVFAQLEREQIKERMMLGKEAKARKGIYSNSAFTPIGYTYDGGLKINDYEAFQVKLIYDMFTSGKSVRSIEKHLLDYNFSHQHGKWNGKTIRNVLSNKVYIGYVNFQGNSYKGTHPCIISEEQFNQAQLLLREASISHQKHNRRKGKRGSLLGGMILCAHCGAKYRSITSGGRWSYYACYSRLKDNYSMIKDPNCKNKIYRRSDLDNLVLNEMRKLKINPTFEEPQNNETQLLKLQLEKIDSQLLRLMDLYTESEIPIETLNKKADALKRQKELLSVKIQDRLPKKEALKRIESIPDLIDNSNLEELQILVDSLIDYIEIDNDDVTIHWKF